MAQRTTPSSISGRREHGYLPWCATASWASAAAQPSISYIRDSFFYGRAFANDEDLNEQASRWLEGTANVRRHSTTGERPVDRFERDEREALGPLARRPYQRFGVQPATEPTRRRVPNTVKVERRSLRVYAEAAG